MTMTMMMMAPQMADCTVSFYKTAALIHCIECVIMITVISQLIYKFISTYKVPSNHPKTSFIASIVLCISTWLQVVNLLITQTLCILETDQMMNGGLSASMFMGLAFTQIYCLLFIFFIRFQYVLKGTCHQFTHKIKSTFHILFSITGMSLICVFVLFIYVDYHIIFIFCAVTVVGIILLIIGIVLLFISKIIKVYNYKTTENDNTFISLITKIILLTSIAVIFTIFDAVTLAVRVYYFSRFTFILYCHATAVNIVTIFFCMILSFKSFNENYDKWCKCCDRNCKKCVDKLASNLKVTTDPQKHEKCRKKSQNDQIHKETHLKVNVSKDPHSYNKPELAWKSSMDSTNGVTGSTPTTNAEMPRNRTVSSVGDNEPSPTPLAIPAVNMMQLAIGISSNSYIEESKSSVPNKGQESEFPTITPTPFRSIAGKRVTISRMSDDRVNAHGNHDELSALKMHNSDTDHTKMSDNNGSSEAESNVTSK